MPQTFASSMVLPAIRPTLVWSRWMPWRPVLRIKLLTTLADAPDAEPERWMPSRPLVMVKPLIVISRPRTKKPSPLAGALIVVLPWPSSVTSTTSAETAIFSLQVPLQRMVSPGLASATLSWIFSPASQFTVWVVGMGLLDGRWQMADGRWRMADGEWRKDVFYS